MSSTVDIPPQRTPFAEPWVELEPSSEEKTLSLTEGITHDHSKSQHSAAQGHPQQTNNHKDLTQLMSAPAVSYSEELRELEAQPFETPGDSAELSNSNERPLPSRPTDSSTLYSMQKSSDPWPTGQTKSPELAPAPPPKPQISENRIHGQGNNLIQGVESQQAKIKEQRNQTYQIRHVNWFDATSTVNPRRSPIMVQNANGPCPLLALVNALVLSTPEYVTSGLVETLRVREQVSLGLLLDAVIDELMSGRRGDTAQDLPDVSDLFAFLINLHTGMNVNPRFVEPLSAPIHLIDDSDLEAPVGASDTRKAGGFEDTPFMRLYSTFAVPLIHGWLPRKNHPVCGALHRCAATYEDAQSLLFAEEDLENKLQTQGLSDEEQRLLQDVASVKQFLTTSPTQLTDYGLDTITETLRPGAIAILFRNDHFSTLYKQPRSGRIYTLVTDMGYSEHDEVVWESLIDISGEGSEFFSGDFRPVGNNVTNTEIAAGPDPRLNEAGWTTVSRSNGRGMPRNSISSNVASGRVEPDSFTSAFSQLSVAEAQDTVSPTKTEQEDHDLALAMHLQEEEEDRQRQEAAARQREDDLSQAYLDSTSRSSQRGGRPQIPPRGGGRRAPPKKQSMDDDAPPPTYEQAATKPAYHPPANNAVHTQMSPRTNVNTTGVQAGRPVRQTSAYSQTNAAFANANRPGPAMRRQQSEKKEEKECAVM